jgi:hypothetical protein
MKIHSDVSVHGRFGPIFWGVAEVNGCTVHSIGLAFGHLQVVVQWIGRNGGSGGHRVVVES